jgi:CheY-like chemotaxis protein
MEILFVDDSSFVHKLFNLTLANSGHTLHFASSGVEALGFLEGGKTVEAIVMDVEMPGMNGWETVRKIREMPHCERIPIVLFTAHGKEVTEERARDAGATSVFHKTDPMELVLHLRELVARGHPLDSKK